MPKFVNSLAADDRYNLMLGLIGYLLTNRNCEVSELESVFKVSNKQIKDTLHLINNGGYFPPDGMDSYPFWVDPIQLDEEDYVEFTTTMETPGAPRISQAQAAALAVGLIHLQSLPTYANDPDIKQLQEIFSKLEGQVATPVIDIKPGTFDAARNLILEAVNSRRRVRMSYINRAGEQSTREIEPVKLIESDGNLSVRSWCLKSEDERSFRIDRMSKLEIMPGAISDEATEMFDRIDELSDLAYNPGEFDHDVVVEVTPEAYSLVSQFHVLHEPTKLSDGVLRVTIKVGRLEHLGKLIARFGGAAKVIEPEIARNIVRDYALVALGRNPLSAHEESAE
jgi:proteasome accessory factor C